MEETSCLSSDTVFGLDIGSYDVLDVNAVEGGYYIFIIPDVKTCVWTKNNIINEDISL